MRGALSIAVCAREHGIANLIVPFENAAEAAVVEGVSVFGVRHLAEVVAMLHQPRRFRPCVQPAQRQRPACRTPIPDFRDVRGQATAKRALEVAAAGVTTS